MKENNFKIFVVEDDEWYREFISYTMELNPEHEVKTFSKGSDALHAMKERPDVVTLDFRLPDTDGATLLKKIKEYNPETEVIIISEQDKIATAVDLLKAGAYDYLVKSKEIRDLLLNTVDHIKHNRKLQNRISDLEKEVKKKYSFQKNIIGNSEGFQHIFSLIEKATQTNINVMITGDTGTGKEEVAKAIHYNSVFKDGPYVAINVAAIPHELAESELFGHEKGAFTGSIGARIGKFEEANNGTIFLDEIGDLNLALQAKLLRVIQEREVVRVGGSKSIKINCRFVVATHKNLQDEVKLKRFREDLYYRLYGLQIKLPPLRERGNDILMLAKHFIENFCRENKMEAKKLSPEAQQKLLAYHFPGNVRELKSLVELATVMASEKEIIAQDILLGEENLISDLLSTELTLEEYNKKIIFHFLQKNDNNVVLVAKKLDIGKSTIYRMLKDEEEKKV
ncbi:MAG: sigma-54 dependent transcriptional regulator [Bacteroidia bacterium]